MVEVKAQEYEFSEGPAVITVDNVQFWCKHGRELKHTQRHKALQFVENDCIRYIGNDQEYDTKYTFICLPLNTDTETFVEFEDGPHTFYKKAFGVDYNDSTYKIYKQEDSRFICNCQGWTVAQRNVPREDGCQCSHVLALLYCFKMGKFQKNKNVNQQITIEEDAGDEI